MPKFNCPHCGMIFEMNYLKWLFTTPFHWFSFRKMKDYRLTKCPYCGKKSYMRKY